MRARCFALTAIARLAWEVTLPQEGRGNHRLDMRLHLAESDAGLLGDIPAFASGWTAGIPQA